MMNGLKSKLVRFAKEEDGGITVFMVVVFVLMIVVSGLSLDLMMHETERADLQNALDRGVLSAAALSQSENPDTIVREFVASRPFARAGRTVNLDVRDAGSSGFRDVSATASFDMPTTIAKLAAQPTFRVPAASRANEGASIVEISLVLDISTSMARQNAGGLNVRRLTLLREAAKDFVSALLANGQRRDFSISLVPYAGGVNAGPFFDHLAAQRDHNHSSCIEFEPEDFNITGLPPANSRGQAPQFHYFTANPPGERGINNRYLGHYVDASGQLVVQGEDSNWGFCPANAHPIVPLSRDVGVLQDTIDDFLGYDGTYTDDAMKWGVAMLDPSIRPLITQLVDSNDIEGDFLGRPLEYDDPDVQKILVLMSDGGTSVRPRPSAEVLADEALREYLSTPDIASVGDDFVVVNNSLHRNRNAQYLENSSNAFLDQTRTDARARLLDMCDLAKGQGIRVFTIGYDISHTSFGLDDLRDCASAQDGGTPDFFEVEGADIAAAFQQIQNVVLALRLVNFGTGVESGVAAN